MKRILSIIVGLILMLTLASCQNGKKFAENDLKESMEALQKGNFSVLKVDKQTEDAFKAFEGAYKKMSYKINKTKEKNKDKILLNVTMKYPDLSATAEMFKDRISKEVQSVRKVYKRVNSFEINACLITAPHFLKTINVVRSLNIHWVYNIVNRFTPFLWSYPPVNNNSPSSLPFCLVHTHS